MSSSLSNSPRRAQAAPDQTPEKDYTAPEQAGLYLQKVELESKHATFMRNQILFKNIESISCKMHM